MTKPNILTFSTLFPNATHPTHGIFVETRLRHLVATGCIHARVMAPVPWFPYAHPKFNKYVWLAKKVAMDEHRYGLDVWHPRYTLVPKIGMSSAPFFLASAAKQALLDRMQKGYTFDLIDAHYFYPDGVAAILLGRYFKKPVVITARGTDLNLIPRYFLPRRMIQWAAREADGLITVCQALKKVLLDMGIEDHKVTVLPNGVDLKLFSPMDRSEVRKQLGLNRPTLLSVGFLIDRKGHHLIMKALQNLPGVDLLIVGDGPKKEELRLLPKQLGVEDRVTFVGEVDQKKLPLYYTAADVLVLASDREGLANVLLESMACGTPVVATNIWGTPEVVSSKDAGLLMVERSHHGVSESVKKLLENPPKRAATRRHAEHFSWERTTQGQLQLFERILR